MSVMGGRATTCLHPVVKKEKNSQIQQGIILSVCNLSTITRNNKGMCRSYCKAKKCHYMNMLESMGEVDHDAVGGIVDIEELVQWSAEKQVCSYYLGRQLAEKAEILLIPYNYILDQRLRKRHKIEVANK